MFDYRSIMSGQRSDPLAVAMRAAMRVASVPYGFAVARRNRRFDSGASTIHRCGVPVISVGNLTTGGTGKTPVVCSLAHWFRNRGVRVAIVSRGYGRGDGDANDEALELHARLPDVPHVQDPDRVEASRIAVEELEAEVILMDDGFQHRRLDRDLNLVVIDATCPFGYGYQLPRGLLREPIASLKRADAVIMTRCDAVQESAIAEIRRVVAEVCDSIPIIRSAHRPAKLIEYPDQYRSIDLLGGRPIAALSAIGNHPAFEETIRSCGGVIVDARRLPDHDPYDPETVADLRGWVGQLGDQIDHVVCTHKDLVKLRTDRLGGKPLVAIEIELDMSDDQHQIDSLLEAIAPEARRQSSQS